MESGRGKTATEIARWVQDNDILADIKPADLIQIKQNTFIDSGPTFSTVCCFARETGNFEAVKIACEAFPSHREIKPDIVSVLRGQGSLFDMYLVK